MERAAEPLARWPPSDLCNGKQPQLCRAEIWTIRPDGSGLTQVTHVPDQPVYLPFWAPDGKRIGFTRGPQGSALLDLFPPHSQPLVLPSTEDGFSFQGMDWSKDGRFLAGVMKRQD